jgi:hypothetical protein
MNKSRSGKNLQENPRTDSGQTHQDELEPGVLRLGAAFFASQPGAVRFGDQSPNQESGDKSPHSKSGIACYCFDAFARRAGYFQFCHALRIPVWCFPRGC